MAVGKTPVSRTRGWYVRTATRHPAARRLASLSEEELFGLRRILDRDSSGDVDFAEFRDFVGMSSDELER